MAGKAWEGTQLLPENRTTNDIVRSSKLDGTGGNGFYIDAVNIALRDIQTNVNAAQDLLASSGAAITAGQGYIIDNGGVAQLPTGISFIRVRGINLPVGAKGFSSNAQAYVKALSTYVPCTYDVGTNKILGFYEIDFSMVDNGVDFEAFVVGGNISGLTATITNYSGGGTDATYEITFSSAVLDVNKSKVIVFGYINALGEQIISSGSVISTTKIRTIVTNLSSFSNEPSGIMPLVYVKIITRLN